MPLNGADQGRYPPDARAAVWRSRDGGANWTDNRNGLPQGGAFFGVMRQAMATDALDPAGIYFGAANGSVYGSRDEGETWTCLAQNLPAISSIETLTRTLMRRARHSPAAAAADDAVSRRRARGADRGRDVADVIDALEAQWPGMRDRLCDTSRRSAATSTYSSTAGARNSTTPLPPGADVYMLTAVSGG